MFFLLSITPVRKPKDGVEKTKLVNAETKIITLFFVSIWSLLIIIGILTISKTNWIGSLSSTGKASEAYLYKDFADMFFKQGNYDLAIANYNKALEIQPNMAEATANLGITYAHMGLPDKAITTLLQATKQNPENPYVIYYNLAEIYDNNGYLKNAVSYYSEALKTAPFLIYTYLKLADIYFYQKEWDLAIDAFNKALDNKFTMKVCFEGMLKRDLHIYAHKPEKRKAIQNILRKGISDKELEKYDNKIFQKTLQNDKNLAIVYNQLGFTYYKKDDLTNAIINFSKALEINPKLMGASINLQAARLKLNNVK